MKKNNKVIPKINYLYLLLMIIIVVILTFMIFEINDNYKNKKLETSYLDGYINNVTIEELNTVLTEPNSDLFIYITKTNNESIYNFETSLKKYIKKNDLRDNFIYIDCTNNETCINNINSILKSNISTIPSILYFKNGIYMKSIESKENILTIGNVEQLLDEYEVK